MNFKKKIKNYGFWVSLGGAVFLLLQSLGIKVNVPYLNEILCSVLGIMVALGIISNPESGNGYLDKNKDDDTPTTENEAVDDFCDNDINNI